MTLIFQGHSRPNVMVSLDSYDIYSNQISPFTSYSHLKCFLSLITRPKFRNIESALDVPQMALNDARPKGTLYMWNYYLPVPNFTPLLELWPLAKFHAQIWQF